MLTTGAMVRTGKTYGNLMVDVQTGSEKRRDRARRMFQGTARHRRVVPRQGLSIESIDKLRVAWWAASSASSSRTR